MTIHVLIAPGLSQREIARRLGVSRNTVARYATSEDAPRYRRRAPRPSKLDPYHDYIRQRMAAAAPDQIAAPAAAARAQVAWLQEPVAQPAGVHEGTPQRDADR